MHLLHESTKWWSFNNSSEIFAWLTGIPILFVELSGWPWPFLKLVEVNKWSSSFPLVYSCTYESFIIQKHFPDRFDATIVQIHNILTNNSRETSHYSLFWMIKETQAITQYPTKTIFIRWNVIIYDLKRFLCHNIVPFCIKLKQEMNKTGKWNNQRILFFLVFQFYYNFISIFLISVLRLCHSGLHLIPLNPLLSLSYSVPSLSPLSLSLSLISSLFYSFISKIAFSRFIAISILLPFIHFTVFVVLPSFLSVSLKKSFSIAPQWEL